jgi:Rieske Fe-S protein
MNLTRRQFLLLTAGLLASCKAVDSNSIVGQERTVNAGRTGHYAPDGVYTNFRNQGFFIIRRGEQLFALSAICTHRKCKLTAEPDRSFYCKCHGSAFDPAGQVTTGPAKRDLPMFPVSPNEQGQLLVKVPVV